MTVVDAVLFECDVDGVGDMLTADFDLSQADAVIFPNGGVTITYHATEMDALAGMNPLMSPYNVTTSAIVFASVIDATTGCTAVAEVTLTVDDCPINITDPCVCLQNASNLINGQFSEEITISGPSGHTWFISSLDGIFETSSPAPPAPPTAFTTGAGGYTLTETPLGGGLSEYILTGVHVDAIGYEIVLENQNGVQRSIDRTICYYPELSWDLPTADLCLFTNPFDVVAMEANGAAGDAEFTLTQNGNVVGSGTGTTFNIDPMALGIGNYTLTFTFDAMTATPNDPTDPGCLQDLVGFFNIVETPTSLGCNSDINLTLDATCQAIVTVDMILEGSYGCFDDYALVITDASGNVVTNNIINPSLVGAVLTTSITHLPSGNMCWGNITVEDKSAPTIDCMDMTIGCDDVLPGAPAATDGCGTVTINMVSETVVDNGCSGMFAEVITRVWEATDGAGNTASCTQVISRERATLADVNFPANYTTDCANHEDDVYQNTDPTDTYTFTFNSTLVGKLISGEPTGVSCGNFVVTKSDEIVEVCTGTYKVLRTWTVADWCAPVGGNLVTAQQVVKIEDTTGPSVATVSDVTVGANSAGCSGVFVAPNLGSDDCSGIASNSFSVGGTPLVTGSSVPVGVHTIDYVVTDGCGNATSGSYQLTVIDNFAPVAICDEFTVASIGSPSPGITGDGTATLQAAIMTTVDQFGSK